MSRRNTFLLRILEQLNSQYEKLSSKKQNEVEILTLIDNKKIMLGDKRNLMVDQAQGKYVVFVDDDDRITETYIADLLEATDSNADVITFKAEVTLNGGEPKICIYSKDFEKDHNTETYNRLPNHICCTKKEFAQQVQFPSVLYGEDSGYSKLLKPLLKTEHFINKILYYYDFNAETTETQEYMRPINSVSRVHTPAILDIVILSNAKDNYFKGLTEQAIKTALETTPEYKLNIIVMEQNKDITYPNVQTVHYDYEFNYNKVANHGARLGNSPYIMIANNDLIFKKDWLFHLLKANHPVVSPKCPIDHRQTQFTENTLGNEIGQHFSGWCFMVTRTVFEQINGFDEDFGFWYADNATVKQLNEQGYTPMLVPQSLVEHLGSQTLKTLPENEKHEKTHGQTNKFLNKYK